MRNNVAQEVKLWAVLRFVRERCFNALFCGSLTPRPILALGILYGNQETVQKASARAGLDFQ
jgi:hypothetical protein